MQVFQNIDNKTFRINGLKYIKNFVIIKQGDTNLAIHNTYDTNFQLLPSTHYNQIQVDGNTFNSLAALIDVLAPLLDYKQFVSTSKIISTTVPSGIPGNGDEWIIYAS
jgi:hypothetical protein